MNATCCFACSADPEDRCSPDPRKRPEVAEGELSSVFERAIEQFPQYGPRVLHRDPWVGASPPPLGPSATSDEVPPLRRPPPAPCARRPPSARRIDRVPPPQSPLTTS